MQIIPKRTPFLIIERWGFVVWEELKMKAKIGLFTFTLVAVGWCLSFPEESYGEPLYNQIQRTIVRLEHATYTKATTQNSGQTTFFKSISDGTAFFVGRKNDFFVVTARHVVDEPYDTYARVPVMDIKTNEVKLFRLELPRNRWQFHPNHGDKDTRYADVAVMKISSLDEQRYILKCLRYNPHEPEQHDFMMNDILPPQDILIFGYPFTLGFELKRQSPLARFGIVAMTTEEKFLRLEGKYLPSKTFIVDSKVFPGNSGSPIVTFGVREQRFMLAGLVIATNNAMDYALAEPVSRIGQTIDIVKDQPLEGRKFWCGPIPEEDEEKRFQSCRELISDLKEKISNY